MQSTCSLVSAMAESTQRASDSEDDKASASSTSTLTLGSTVWTSDQLGKFLKLTTEQQERLDALTDGREIVCPSSPQKKSEPEPPKPATEVGMRNVVLKPGKRTKKNRPGKEKRIRLARKASRAASCATDHQHQPGHGSAISIPRPPSPPLPRRKLLNSGK